VTEIKRNMEALSKAKLAYYRELLQKKQRRLRKEFLVEGVRLCKEALRQKNRVSILILTDKFFMHEQSHEILQQAKEQNIVLYTTTQESLNKLTDTCNPQTIVACVRQENMIASTEYFQAQRFLVLYDISDPGNIGTLLRTAEAFGWNHVILLGDTTEIYNPKIIRASMGAFFRIQIICLTLEKCLSYFQENHVHIFLTMPHAKTKFSLPPSSEKIALILGSEAHGLPPSLQEQNVQEICIPMTPQVESLNVAIAGGILLYELRDKTKTIE